MLDVRHLKSLSVFRETGSLVETAERLYLIQPALSYQFKELEERLGKHGLQVMLYAALREDMLDAPFMQDFLLTAKDTSFSILEGVSMVKQD